MPPREHGALACVAVLDPVSLRAAVHVSVRTLHKELHPAMQLLTQLNSHGKERGSPE